MDGSPMNTAEVSGRLARVAALSPEQLRAIAVVVAAVLFGLAGLIGAIGYLVSVTRYREGLRSRRQNGGPSPPSATIG
jgi:hypothetical protein